MSDDSERDYGLLDPEVLHGQTELVPYRVRTGDSLKSLGERFGCRWQDIALLNWGTDRPKVINWYLEHHVGCRRNQNGYFVFSDADVPGIVYLPKALVRKTKRMPKGTLCVSRYAAAA
jgi:hypothetical protein